MAFLTCLAIGAGCCLGHLDLFSSNNLNSVFAYDSRNIPRRQKQKLKGLLSPKSPDLPQCHFHHILLSYIVSHWVSPDSKDGEIDYLMMAGALDKELLQAWAVSCHTTSGASFPTWLLLCISEPSRRYLCSCAAVLLNFWPSHL